MNVNRDPPEIHRLWLRAELETWTRIRGVVAGAILGSALGRNPWVILAAGALWLVIWSIMRIVEEESRKI